MYFLFCGVSNSMPVAPPAPASLWMLFMSLFLEQGGDHNIPLGLLQEEGWSLWVCWKSVCSMPAGSVCGNQKPKELQEGEEEAWGHAEHFGVLLRVVVNVCTHSLFSSVWMICYFWSLFLTGAEVQGIVSGSWTPEAKDQGYPRQQNWCPPLHLENGPKRRTKYNSYYQETYGSNCVWKIWINIFVSYFALTLTLYNLLFSDKAIQKVQWSCFRFNVHKMVFDWKNNLSVL